MKPYPYVAVLCACFLTFVAPRLRAQHARSSLIDMVLDCTMHEEAGPWVPANLRRDGILRFNFIDIPPHSTRGPYEYNDDLHRLYAAFWDPSRTKAEFLDFSI